MDDQEREFLLDLYEALQDGFTKYFEDEGEVPEFFKQFREFELDSENFDAPALIDSRDVRYSTMIRKLKDRRYEVDFTGYELITPVATFYRLGRENLENFLFNQIQKIPQFNSLESVTTGLHPVGDDEKYLAMNVIFNFL